MRSLVGVNLILSSVSVLMVTAFRGDCFMGVRGVESRLRFREEGIASSMSVDSCGDSTEYSFLIDVS